jgi:hypothetical protein
MGEAEPLLLNQRGNAEAIRYSAPPEKDQFSVEVTHVSVY